MEQDNKLLSKKEFLEDVRDAEENDPIDWGMVLLDENETLKTISSDVYDYIKQLPEEKRLRYVSALLAKNITEVTVLRIQQAMFLQNDPKFYGKPKKNG